MNFTPFGAAREVTGSMHLLSLEKDNILLDFGLFQGRRQEADAKNRVIPFDPSIITTLVLSHAHIDHCGRIPILMKMNFRGRVTATRATVDACHYLLRDSARIQESDALYLNYKSVRKFLQQSPGSSGKREQPSHKEAREIKKLLKIDDRTINDRAVNGIIDQYRLEAVKPLYSVADAEESFRYFDGYPYERPFVIGNQVTCTFYEAGHILGSAMPMIQARIGNRIRRILFTGDFGRFGKPIIKDPTLHFPEKERKIDLLIMESTYGNRLHESFSGQRDRLIGILKETWARKGSVIIPSFAFGRTQELIYVLHKLYDQGAVPKFPIYIDSPLATELTQVFGEHPEVYNESAQREFLSRDENPFQFEQVHYIQSVGESLELMRRQDPHIVISASGMCEAGRILHHLRYKIHNPLNTILFVGYLAEHTLGRRIVELARTRDAKRGYAAPPQIKFLNKTYPLQAQVHEIGGFSAHGDRNDLLRFLDESRLNIKKIALVHGEEDQIEPFRSVLAGRGYQVVIPRTGESIEV